MKYNDVMEYLEEKVNILGSVMGLDTLRELLKRMENPQKELTFIHIAGTNGKGSVGTFLTDALIANGYRVGRYLSPVVTDYCEKIQVNHKYVTKAFVARQMEAMFSISQEMVKDGLAHPTTFELETAMAFAYFLKMKCDYVVLECGMGGLEDATNVIQAPLITVFTEISLDHMAILGDTVDKIAEVKAGIIKNGSYVVSAIQKPEVAEIIQKKSEQCNVPCEFVDALRIRHLSASLKGQKFTYKGFGNVFIPLLGTYQIENAALAVLALEALSSCGVLLSKERSIAGMAVSEWPGRFEVIGKNPVVVLDGAHNEAAVKKLTETIENHFQDKRKIYIMGVLKDKDYNKMIGQAVGSAEAIITLTPPIRERALPAYELADVIRQYHPNVTAADSVEEALEMAILLAGRDGVVIAFGSLSYLGAMKTAYGKQYGKLRR